VRDFLSYAFHRWRQPAPRYVLLVGDATYDFKDYLGTGVQNRVPPYLVKTSFLWTASDPALAAVNGEDLLPDLAIGRLPAANETEARAMVEKILFYERTGRLSGGAATLVADNPDEAGDFESHAEELARGPLAGRSPETIYLSRLGPDGARRAIKDALDRGTSLLTYMGHGGIHLWASENVFDIYELNALEPQAEQPLLLTLNCLNGYFHFPYFNSLGEAFLKASGKGRRGLLSERFEPRRTGAQAPQGAPDGATVGTAPTVGRRGSGGAIGLRVRRRLSRAFADLPPARGSRAQTSLTRRPSRAGPCHLA